MSINFVRKQFLVIFRVFEKERMGPVLTKSCKNHVWQMVIYVKNCGGDVLSSFASVEKASVFVCSAIDGLVN